MKQLILCEKPSAALKIADSLADGKVKAYKEDGVPYYNIQIKGKETVVCCTVGHLFNLTEKNKQSLKYPVFDIEWKESFKVKKKNAYAEKYFDLLKVLSKDVNEFIIATDKDLEGEVIGWNILRYIFGKENGLRMEFSTLTKDDLIESYNNVKKNIDFPLAHSGETRHILDWIWGINTSRALTLAIKSAGAFKLMSSGRVQGPALNLIVKREKEIQNFKSVPFWLVSLVTNNFIAEHIKGNIWDKKEAEKVLENTKGKPGFIKKISKREFLQEPPHPFDLTSLQIEAYKTLKINPKETLSIAQDLYINGFISYPRTSSQKLPLALNFKKILSKLKNNSNYDEICSELLNKKELKPNEGKKSDPAHPAIYPTGEIGKIAEKEAKLYDLIVHRFLATFGTPAKREASNIEIEVNNEIFIASGTRTIEKGWHQLYGEYVKFEEIDLPKLNEGEELENKGVKVHDKETQPPKRYTQASIIKELEKRNLGTKSTRAQIVDSLYQRNYIQENSIEVTDLGLKTAETLKKYVPTILDENLTRHFEIDMEKIQDGKKKPESILNEAKKIIEEISENFKKKEEKIGKELLEANRETQAQASLIGKCPNCDKGLLNIRRGKFGSFVACDSYPDCKTTFSIPKGALVKNTKDTCQECNCPKILIIRQGKRPMELCINKDCPTKKSDVKLDKNKKCPECGSELVIRKGIYGAFLACSSYPKCKYIDTSFSRKRTEKSPI